MTTLKLRQNNNSQEEPGSYEQEHVEQVFLDGLQSRGKLVQIYLVSGIKMVGTILGTDDFTILISTRSFGMQMLYKHAITTISAANQEEQ